tara:strand:+ start:3319 stop:5178 length:1860 start_codon:yes stop_codon:yes gene_type:complete
MADLKRDIKYIDRDFNDFRGALIEYSKTYFPNTYNDFSNTSTGMLFMEMASYVGDVLSFYLDNQIQETFIQYARQTQNLFNLSYMLGYTPKVTTAASVNIDFFQTLPAKTVGSTQLPDFDYCLQIPENTQISSNNSNTRFLIEDFIDFSSSSSLDPTTITVYEITGNEPTSFLLKKTRKSISATVNTQTLTFGNGVKFDIRNINAANIIGILDVVDSNGNTWYEVPNLSQDAVFDTIKNTNTNDPNAYEDNEVPYLLQLKQVQRRFASRFINEGTLQLQFGAGSTGDTTEEIVPNPENVGSGLPFERTQLTTAFSPVNFVFTNTYGISPSNITLTVRYLTGGGVSSNVPSGTMTLVDTSNVTFIKPNLSNSTLANSTFNSLASNNPLAADGGQDGDTIEELRQNALGSFQNQLRTVTSQDYLIRSLSMPSNLGVVAKAFATPTKISDVTQTNLPTILDLYVLSYDINKNLRTASPTLKNNLKTYLSEYRMVNDKINIKDAFIINIGVEFDIIVLPNFNNNEVITKCIDAITDFFNIDKWQVNEPIMLKDIFILLDKIEGVQTVQDLRILNKIGENYGYSAYAYDIPGATIKNVVYPSLDPMVFEIKFPNTDIKGRVVPL